MNNPLRFIFDTLHSARVGMIDKLNYNQTYRRLVHVLKRGHREERAMEIAVGGDFDAVGTLELELLKHYGLSSTDYVVDVGCGSGRLAKSLLNFSTGQYLGTDVVPELVTYARNKFGRPGWRFEVTNGLTIPEQDGVADYICFFSVFTHLLHEESYRYLQDARRVLRPGGRIVFSFLDFTITNHWSVFEANLKDLSIKSHPLNMFMSKDSIHVWAEHLDLEVATIEDGDRRFIPLSKPITFDSGEVREGIVAFWQSVAVLNKD